MFFLSLVFHTTRFQHAKCWGNQGLDAHLKQMGLDQDPHCSHSSEMLGDSDASKDNRSPKCVMILMQWVDEKGASTGNPDFYWLFVVKTMVSCRFCRWWTLRMAWTYKLVPDFFTSRWSVWPTAQRIIQNLSEFVSFLPALYFGYLFFKPRQIRKSLDKWRWLTILVHHISSHCYSVMKLSYVRINPKYTID